jgi:hypothetical protein
VSQFEARPSYQSGLGIRAARRLNPDVAYVADPKTPLVILYNGHWLHVGGTSIGPPQWAALIAIADQGRARAGRPPLDGNSQTLAALYRLPARDFHDVTRGNNGFAAGVGFDLVTGRGTPRVPLLINDLVNAFKVVSRRQTWSPLRSLIGLSRVVVRSLATPSARVNVAFAHTNWSKE